VFDDVPQLTEPIAGCHAGLGCVDAHVIGFRIFGDHVVAEVGGIALGVDRQEICRLGQGVDGFAGD
jgi:hypothetical protein